MSGLTSCGPVENIDGETSEGFTSCGDPTFDLGLSVSPFRTAKRYGVVEIGKFIEDEGKVEITKDGEVVWESPSVTGQATFEPSREELVFDRDGETKEIKAQFIPDGASSPVYVTSAQNLTVDVEKVKKTVSTQ